MAPPQKAIEQLSREPVKTPGWSYHVLMVAGTIFFLSFMLSLGLRFGYKPYYARGLAAVKKQIDEFQLQIPEADRERIIVSYSQLSNLSSLLAKQPVASRAFSWFEKHTHPNVFFSKFDLNVVKRDLALSGRAKTIEDVAEQLRVYGNRGSIKGGPPGDPQKVNFTGTSYDEARGARGATTTSEGSWPFNATLTFESKFFSGQGGESR